MVAEQNQKLHKLYIKTNSNSSVGAGARECNTRQNEILPRALQLKRAAQYIDVSEMSMRRLIKRGLIKPNRALRHILIPVAELDRFLSR